MSDSEDFYDPPTCWSCGNYRCDYWGRVVRHSLQTHCHDCWLRYVATEEEREQQAEWEKEGMRLVDEAEYEDSMKLMCKWHVLVALHLGLLRWSQRAVAKVEAEYAPDGPRGKRIILDWPPIAAL